MYYNSFSKVSNSLNQIKILTVFVVSSTNSFLRHHRCIIWTGTKVDHFLSALVDLLVLYSPILVVQVVKLGTREMETIRRTRVQFAWTELRENLLHSPIGVSDHRFLRVAHRCGVRAQVKPIRASRRLCFHRSIISAESGFPLSSRYIKYSAGIQAHGEFDSLSFGASAREFMTRSPIIIGITFLRNINYYRSTVSKYLSLGASVHVIETMLNCIMNARELKDDNIPYRPRQGKR